MIPVPKRLAGVKTVSHNHAPKQEANMASSYGGKVVKGSGCGSEKGDVRIAGVARIECKSTKNKSFSLKLSVLDKIEEEATCAGEIPILQLDFINDQATTVKRVAIVPLHVLDTILERARQDGF